MEPAFTVTDVITDLGHDVFQVDTRMAGYDGITAGYLIRGERPCLVETGAAPSAPLVRDALAALGIGPADLATVAVTRIHLDHAGGAGDIAGMFPAAEVVVHELGARHLADPSRRMSSARQVYGDELDGLFAALKPARLLFSHFGPVTDIEETLDRAAAEINLWAAERTRQRYAALAPEADPEVMAKVERVSGAAANVAGIMHWLDRADQG
jgi:hypothetical protein